MKNIYKVWKDDKVIFVGDSTEVKDLLKLKDRDKVTAAEREQTAVRETYLITLEKDNLDIRTIEIDGVKYTGSRVKISNDANINLRTVTYYFKKNIYKASFRNKKEVRVGKEDVLYDYCVRHLQLPPYYKTVLNGKVNVNPILERLKKSGFNTKCILKKDNRGEKYYTLEIVND